VSATTGAAIARNNTAALFVRASRNSERVIVPVNESAISADQTHPAFFCVHSASGVAGTDFMDLARCLDPSIRFFGIQAPPKRMGDVEFGKSVEQLAEHYADALIQFQPTGPILLGGYCVGGVIALEMGKILRDRGREVGPLLVIDGVPENTGIGVRRWGFKYWMELMRNARGWFSHGDLMRKRTLQSLAWSITNNASAISKSVMGLKRGQKIGGGYGVEGIMDVSRYDPAHKSFVNRLFGALFTYSPKRYAGDVVVYEAAVKPLLYLPKIGDAWKSFAPQSTVIEIVGTHISMMHDPYVGPLAADIRKRISDFFAAKAAR
jgi:thioesterase domain-containing protein